MLTARKTYVEQTEEFELELYLLAGQGVHAVLDGNAKVPGAHETHEERNAARGRGDANPPGHDVHTPSALYFPATQATHVAGVVAPARGVVSPGVQSVQTVAPEVAEYLPIGQYAHS